MGQEKYPSQRKNGDKNVEGSVPKARNIRMLLSGRNHCDLTVKPSAQIVINHHNSSVPLQRNVKDKN